MATESEVNFIKDLLVELRSLADEPSEFLAEEVDQAIEILDTLQQYNTSAVLTLMENINMNEQEMMDYAEQLVAGYDASTQAFDPETVAFLEANVPAAEDQARIKALSDELMANKLSTEVVEACEPEVVTTEA